MGLVTAVEELLEHLPGYGSCEPGTPGMQACDAPLALCDDPWGTGVPGCADLRVDPGNCGGCGVRCPSGVCAGGHCVDSECEISCEGTTVCCPDPWRRGIPGCTSPGRDPSNCGGCGVLCAPGQICDHGTCACGAGRRDCGTGTCTSVKSDPRNCGECGRLCTGGRPVCDMGTCVADCVSDLLAACGGFCVDLQSNDDHCGGCGMSCGHGTGTTQCLDGRCLTCAEEGLTDCDGKCVELDWSDGNCGQCGNECAAGEVCVFGTCDAGDGSCAASCPEGDQICCSGTCVDPRTNDNHCGGCGVDTCDPDCTEACRDGRCVAVGCGDDD